MSDIISKLGIEEEVAALEELSGEESSPSLVDSSSGTDSIGYDRDQIEEYARRDLNFLAGLAMPEVFEYLFPPMFLAIWQWLIGYVHQSRTFPKLALGIPRGFAKTTFVKLFILYCILFTTRRFILIVSSTESHAKNIISDVMNFLDEPNIQKVFGDAGLGVTIDKQEFKRFAYRGRTISIAGIGATGSVRGLNVGHARPDIMIFEDFQTKEDSKSLELSKALLERMTGTIMKAKDPKGCVYLYIGNMYNTPGCILKILRKAANWLKFVVGGILADGTSLWEDLHPVSQLLEEFEADKAIGQEDVFYAEVLNDELSGISAGIDVSTINISPFTSHDTPQGKFIVLDPSGEKETSDKNAIGYFETYDGSPVFTEAVQGHWSPLQLIVNALILALKTKTSCIFVENVAYQASLLFWFEHVCKTVGLTGFNFLPISPKGKSKNSRIKDALKSLVSTKKELYVHQRILPLLRQQAIDWNPNAKHNVDELLDLLAYSQDVIVTYSDLIAQEYILQSPTQDPSLVGVLPVELTSPI